MRRASCTIIEMREIRLDGSVVARTACGRAILAEEIAALATADVRRRFAMAMCVYALDCDERGGSREYLDEDAEAYARELLMPKTAMLASWSESDALLAARFGVPLAQLCVRRCEVTSPES